MGYFFYKPRLPQLVLAILAVVTLVIPIVAHSSNERAQRKIENFPIEMRYMIDSRTRDIGEISRARLGAWAERMGESAYFPKGLPVEGVIASRDLKRWILITPNRRVNPEYIGRAFALRGGQLLHLKIGDEQLAILMNGYSENEALSLFDFISNESVADAKVIGGNRAPASEAVGSDSGGAEKAGNSSSSSPGLREHAYALEESFAACAVGVKEGVEGALISPFTMAWGSVKSLAKNPSAWWERSVNEMADVMETASDFNTYAKKKWSDFKSKPESEKSKLYCSFVGGPAALGAVAKVSRIGAVAETASAAGKVKPVANAAGSTAAAESLKKLVHSLDEVIDGLRSSSPEAVKVALEKAKKLDVRSVSDEAITTYGLGNFNGKVAEVSDAIKAVIEKGATTEALKLQAAEAYLVYGKTVTNGWTQGYLGRHMADLLPDVYQNYSLPDSVRRVLYNGLEEQRAAIGFPSRPFETAAALKAKDTVGFLGVTKKSLTYAQRGNAYVAERYFSTQPVGVQREIYSVLESGRPLPAKYMAEYAKGAEISNLNGLRGTLQQAGYTATASQRGNLITYTHPETKSQIIISSEKKLSGGSLLRTYTEDEIRRLRAAISQPNGRYTVTTNAAH